MNKVQIDILNNMQKNKTGIFAVILFLVGMFIRIWWVNSIPSAQMYDFATYQQLAVNIMNGEGHTLNGVPIAWQGPAYAYVLGIFYKLIGSSGEIYGKYLNIFFSMQMLINCYFIFRKLNEKYAVPGFAIAALTPSFIAYNNALGTEVFFLTTLTYLLVVQLYMKKEIARNTLLGILCGILALTKPFMLAYPFILAVIEWVDTKNIKSTVITFGFVIMVAVIVISPWTYRNYKLYNRLIPISYNSGYVLYINNNSSNVTGSWLDLKTIESEKGETAYDISKYLDGTASIKEAHEIEPILKHEAQKWIKENFTEFLKLGVLRVKSTFFAGANDIMQWGMNGWLDTEIAGNNTNIESADSDSDAEADTNNNFKVAIAMRNFNVISTIFDCIIYILSGSAFLFLFLYVKKYALACLTNHRHIDLSINIIFINIAFFVVIDFVFEGQARYNFPVIIFMISALVHISSKVLGSRDGL